MAGEYPGRAFRAIQRGADDVAERVNGSNASDVDLGSEVVDEIVLEVKVDRTYFLGARKDDLSDRVVPAVVLAPGVRHGFLPPKVILERTYDRRQIWVDW